VPGVATDGRVAFVLVPVYAELSSSAIVVSPGGEEVERLTIRNLGTATESYAVVPLGICAGWTLIDPPTLTLFPGEEQTLKVTLRPPRSPSVAAGDSVLALRIVPHGQPDDAATIEASLTVLSFAQRRLSVLQPVQRARRRATYDIVLENQGNAQASCRLVLADAAGHLIGRFDPPSIGVDPGQNATSQVRVTAKGLRWTGGTQTLPFTIEAAQDGFAPADTTATLLQPTILSRRTIGSLAVLVAGLVGLGAAWNWVVRPAIDDAAADAVGELAISTVAPPDTTDIGDDPDDSVAPDDSTPVTAPDVDASDEGTPLSFRMSITSPVGQSTSEDFTPRRNQRVEITDIVLQDPNEDIGTLTISNDGETLLVFQLIDLLSYEPIELQTPIVVAPGTPLTVSLTCTSAGDATTGVCNPAVFFSGVVVRP
jgi:hypothetical protein